MSWMKYPKVLQRVCTFSLSSKGGSLASLQFHSHSISTGTLQTQGFREHLQRTRKKTEICSDQPLPCIWMVCPRSTASRSLLTTEISFPSRIAAVCFIKSLGLELKEVWVVVRVLHSYTELKHPRGEMKKDSLPS